MDGSQTFPTIAISITRRRANYCAPCPRALICGRTAHRLTIRERFIAAPQTRLPLRFSLTRYGILDRRSSFHRVCLSITTSARSNAPSIPTAARSSARALSRWRNEVFVRKSYGLITRGSSGKSPGENATRTQLIIPRSLTGACSERCRN